SSTRSVKVSLRYPANRSSDPAAGAMYSDFNYSLIVAETNSVSQTTGMAVDTRNPQVVIPQYAWSYFEQSARGPDADIYIPRCPDVTGTADLESENRRTIRFVNGQLKGTVYYNSYNSPQGGNTGAILKIDPGATSPTLAVQPPNGSGRRCTVCHS